MRSAAKAAPPGGLRPFGAPLLLLDSISEAADQAAGAVVVSGSHGGTSAARLALAAGVRVAVFNDAGGGLDGAGVAGLGLLQAQGVAACAVAHGSARIGEAASTWATGVVSHANAAAQALGARPGMAVAAWLQAAAALEPREPGPAL